MHFTGSMFLNPLKSLRLNFKSFVFCSHKRYKILPMFPLQESVSGELQGIVREALS